MWLFIMWGYMDMYTRAHIHTYTRAQIHTYILFGKIRVVNTEPVPKINNENKMYPYLKPY